MPKTATDPMALIRKRLPSSWRIERLHGATTVFDGAYRLLSGTRAQGGEMWVQFKHRAGTREVRQFLKQGRAFAADNRALILAAPYIPPAARKLIEDQLGFGYIDDTGNMWVTMAEPPVFLRDRGADTNPDPKTTGQQSLRGPAAARAVRALVDFRAPVGLRQLSNHIRDTAEPDAKVPPSALSRTLGLLRHEGLVEQDQTGRIVSTDWQGIIRRWALDYNIKKASKSIEHLLVARGIPWAQQQLSQYEGRYALTGRSAVHPLVREAPMRRLTVYVEDMQAVHRLLKLTRPPQQAAANVVLITPNHGGVFARRVLGPNPALEGEPRLWRVGYSQLAVDLLTGPERQPAEGEALLERMANHTTTWRETVGSSCP